MGVIQDLRFALRVLVRKPTFTAIVVLTLALGIGAGSAMFSIIHALLVRPLDFPELDRLAMIQVSENGDQFDDSASPRAFLDYQRDAQSFERLAAYQYWEVPLSGSGDPEQVLAFQVSPGYFDMFGVRPALGRWFADDEVDGQKENVVILSHALWDRRYGRDPSIVGKPIIVAGASYVVVGVMPATFRFPTPAELWAPLTLTPSQRQDRGGRYLGLVGKVKPGVTIAAADAEMRQMGGLHAQTYREDQKRVVRVVTLVSGITEDYTRNFIFVLLGAALLVLLIACANVANLFLAHALARRKELAVRAALGAGRRRIVRQLLTEAALLGVVSGAGSLLLASWAVDLVKGAMPRSIVRFIAAWDTMGVEPAVLAFALGCGVVVGFVFGIVPAIQVSRSDLNSTLKDSDRGTTGGRDTHRMRNLLVVAQIALALLLLLGAGAMVKGFARMANPPRGVDLDGVLSFKVTLPQARELKPQQEIVAFARDALDRLRALPGIEGAGAVNNVPFGNNGSTRVPFPEGRVVQREDEIGVDYRPATPGYLELLRIPRLDGRSLEERDGVDAPRVAVISQTAARRLWPGESPIGKRFRWGRDDKLPWVTVVGVVGDVHDRPYDPGPRGQVWMPFVQQAPVTMYFVIRTRGEPMATARAAARAIYAVDPNQPVTDMRTLAMVQSERISGMRIGTWMMAGFAILALILSAVGIYGVVATLVTQRRPEIGVRMALGARRGDVLRLVLGRGAILTAAGIVLGLGAGILLVRFLASVLVGAIDNDTIVFVVFTTVVAVIATLGSLVPAWRATKVDALAALRQD